MKIKSLLWLAAALASAPRPDTLAAEPAEAAVVFGDSFEGKLAGGWSWLREDPAGWRVGAQGLEVRVQPGNMWGGANNARNVLVRPIPPPLEAPIEIAVTLSNAPTGQWEQVNLVWFYDDSHMVKLGQELVTGRLSVVMGREEADRARTIGIVPLDGLTVELRLQALGSRLRGQFRTAPWREWRDVGECDLPVKGDPKASLQFYQGPPSAPHWARATHFAVRRLPVANMDWPRTKVAEQALSAGDPARSLARLPLSGGLELVNDLRPLGQAAATTAQQSVYRHGDGSWGWSWDRRNTGVKAPAFCGVVLGKTRFANVDGFAPSAVAELSTLALESHTVTRLENDHGDHNFALGVSLAAAGNSDVLPADELVIEFDWYGPAASAQTLNDGYRDYGFVPQASATSLSPRRHVYRIAGFRGLPPRVNLKPFLEDLSRREPGRLFRVVGLWLGNEVWDGSRGATLVSRLQWTVNGQRPR